MACTHRGIGEVVYCKEYPLPLGRREGACTSSPMWTTLPAVEVEAAAVAAAREATDLTLMFALPVMEAPRPVWIAVPRSWEVPDLRATAVAVALARGPQGLARGTTIDTTYLTRLRRPWTCGFPSIGRPSGPVSFVKLEFSTPKGPRSKEPKPSVLSFNELTKRPSRPLYDLDHGYGENRFPLLSPSI